MFPDYAALIRATLALIERVSGEKICKSMAFEGSSKGAGTANANRSPSQNQYIMRHLI